MKPIVIALEILAVALVLYFVWPTPYAYKDITVYSIERPSGETIERPAKETPDQIVDRVLRAPHATLRREFKRIRINRLFSIADELRGTWVPVQLPARCEKEPFEPADIEDIESCYWEGN